MLPGAGALDTFSHQYCFSDKYHLIVPHLTGAGSEANMVYEPEKTKRELYELISSLHKDKVGVIGHSHCLYNIVDQIKEIKSNKKNIK